MFKIFLWIFIHISTSSYQLNIWFLSRGFDTVIFRQYKDISKNKIGSRGIFGGSYHETSTSILRSSFTSPIISDILSFLLVCQDNRRMNFMKWLKNISTIIYHQPLFFKISCIKWRCGWVYPVHNILSE